MSILVVIRLVLLCALFREYPKLQQGGGFEILRVKTRKVYNLEVVSTGPKAVPILKEFSKSGVLYLRPLQLSLDVTPLPELLQQHRKIACLTCNQEVYEDEMRQHLKNHRNSSATINDDDLWFDDDVVEIENSDPMDTNNVGQGVFCYIVFQKIKF